MKAIQRLRLVAGAMLITAGSLQAYAQDAPGPATASSGATLSARQQSKAARAADRVLSHKIRTELAKDKDLNGASISVRVKDGAVTLQGLVRDQAQSERATEIANGVPGVTSVKSTLTNRSIGN